MPDHDILSLLVLIFGISGIVVFLLHRIKIPPLVGFIVSGVLIGPHGLGLAKNTENVELLAEIGVVLLLFVVGIEFSIENLRKMKKAVLLGGGMQVFLTVLLTALVAYPFFKEVKQSLFCGFLVALSSTALVLKMLAERGEVDSPQGRLMTGILIFQDFIVVPLMLIIPLLGGGEFNFLDLGLKMTKAAAIVVVVLFASRWLVPHMLHQVVHVRSRELFVTVVIFLCLGTALLTSQFGLSLALGAFLSGLVISESEYAHQAMAEILPFRDSFIGFFFVSVGMLLDVRYSAGHWLGLSIAVAVILIIKTITGTTAALIVRSPVRTALITSFSLSQIGEFSFVLLGAGMAAKLISGEFYQLFLSASLVTMLLTPFVFKAAPSMAAWSATRLFSRRFRRLTGRAERQSFPEGMSDHVIIVGFGLNGRNLARVLRQTDIPYVVLEMNSDAVREMKKKGEPIYYGDGTSTQLLHRMGIETAKVLVVVISDAASARHIVQAARRINPHVHIVVRTRYIAEVDDLKKLGANEVIPEEFETSIEIFSKVLDYFSLPRNMIDDYIDIVRSDSYNVLRRLELPAKELCEWREIMKGIHTESYVIKEGIWIEGQTISETALRAKTGITIIAVQREGQIHQNPQPHLVLKKDDILLLIGERKDINKALTYMETGSL